MDENKKEAIKLLEKMTFYPSSVCCESCNDNAEIKTEVLTLLAEKPCEPEALRILEAGCTTMPESCIVWPCCKTPKKAILSPDENGFMCCPICGRSYGKPCETCGGSKIKTTIHTPQDTYPRPTHRKEPCPACQDDTVEFVKEFREVIADAKEVGLVDETKIGQWAVKAADFIESQQQIIRSKDTAMEVQSALLAKLQAD